MTNPVPTPEPLGSSVLIVTTEGAHDLNSSAGGSGFRSCSLGGAGVYSAPAAGAACSGAGTAATVWAGVSLVELASPPSSAWGVVSEGAFAPATQRVPQATWFHPL